MNRSTPLKYRTLEIVLERLFMPLAAQRLAITERWREDERAIGFFKPGEPELSAYVTTHGQPLGRYSVHLEYPPLDENDRGNTPTVAENVDIDHLIDLLDMHFGLFAPFGGTQQG
jgi:hypothetical protein